LISLHRKYRWDDRVSLHEVIAALRLQEAKSRGTDITGIDLTQSEIIPGCGGWYLLGDVLKEGRVLSGKFVCCGSRSHPLEKAEEVTHLTRNEIYRTIRQVMKKLKWPLENKQEPAAKPTPAKKTTARTKTKKKVPTKKAAAAKKPKKKAVAKKK